MPAPITKGRLGKPVEFEHKAQVVDNDDGIVLDHTVQQGNPPDAPQLAPAVAWVKKRAGRTPRTVTADRGYGEAAVDQQLTEVGVKNVLIPRKGKPSQDRRAEEHRKAFRRTIKWRTGCEGRISHLKRGYGWDRGRIGGLEGTRTWVGHGVVRPQPGHDQRPPRITGPPGAPYTRKPRSAFSPPKPDIPPGHLFRPK